MIVLNDDTVRERLKWPDVLAALEQAFKLRYKNPKAFIMPERVGMGVDHGNLLTMPCADQDGWFGVKQVAVIPDNPRRNKPSVQAWYTLFDPTGTPVLACSATFLTKFRTSAVSAIAAKYLAFPNSNTLLVIGTGSLAPWMAEAHTQTIRYQKVLVWGRDKERTQRTVGTIRGRLRMKVEPIFDLERALFESDVVSVATTSRTPIIQGKHVRYGHHFDLVGAFIPEMIEVNVDVVKGASVYVDDLDACKVEAGDLIQAEEYGWSFNRVKGDLAKVVSEHVIRTNVTLFKSVGLALEDLVVAKLLVGSHLN
jgi:ornithine cyclodeaminase/alanine dehydrogenase-like protein (mu-crystallin family)